MRRLLVNFFGLQNFEATSIEHPSIVRGNRVDQAGAWFGRQFTEAALLRIRKCPAHVQRLVCAELLARFRTIHVRLHIVDLMIGQIVGGQMPKYTFALD